MFQFWGIEFTPIRIACAVAVFVVIAYVVRKYYVSKSNESFKPNPSQNSQNSQPSHHESYQDDIDDLDDELEGFDDDLDEILEDEEV